MSGFHFNRKENNMTKDEAIGAIKEVVDEVVVSWVADDGGLTMAANDIIDFADNCIAAIKRNDIEWAHELNQFDADTGAEGEIIEAVHDWLRSRGE
jgi:hypothetical protein